ncbi:hypothetical protein ACFL3C_03615 [Patescibacteria group bacterium]
MNLEHNIQKIALIFFFITGTAHIISYLMILNGYAPDTAFMIRTIVEIPFIITAAIYGFISLKISIAQPDKKHKISNILFIAFIIVLFAALIYLNLFIPDRF